MTFDSVQYLIFLPLVLCSYFFLGYRAQNILLLGASLFFYGWWDWRFLPLIILSAVVDYGSALGIERSAGAAKKRWLLASVAVNLGVLGTFKYLGFFVDSTAAALAALGLSAHTPTLELVLPVGISFYTFQSMSYSIDVYRGRLKPERDFPTFLTYIAFFPQLVAGPIERAGHMLPQFKRKRTVSRAQLKEGIWNIAWGMFQKVVISDSVARFADAAFGREINGANFVVGTLAFGLQIYCDFNAYSLIARGSASLFGFELQWNFTRPYFSTSLREFWQRWHRSLGSWLRDYVYIPLGGNRHGSRRTGINLMTTMLLGGLWHGAGWNFVLWGGLHGLGLAAERTMKAPLPPVIGWCVTMLVVFSGWMLFRADDPWLLATALMSMTQFDWAWSHVVTLISIAALALPVIAVDAWGARTHELAPGAGLSTAPFACLTGALAFATWSFFGRYDAPFVYFQF